MAGPKLVADKGFTEVAHRVWVARHAWLDVNVTVVAGDRGLLVVAALGADRAARALAEELRRLGRGEVVAVVNTHEHFDHTFGNRALRDAWPEAQLVAHEDAAASTVASGDAAKAVYADDVDDPHRADVLATEPLPADRTFSSVWALDLGDRVAEVVHPGRGHTAGDVVVRVPDADVLVAGDLVEESAPPSYGPDSFPLDWPASLDLALGLVGDGTVVVPGHGDVVGIDFVRDQRGDIGMVAETIYDLASRSVPLEDALRHTEWPFPAERLGDAVRRGYEQVPRTARRLPLV
ncbi:MAG: MBL-fold metallo-hydrolase superfamily [uncultured Nocardioidaceae bacterium]|uniref:MBL-fold metallo-hydrolase superfamily n=1 Tax=uncultured Nocardioidaceae bacterium TaxID=253824 RepID=A0A6J4MVK6_9ACTN|nr:MAG: MBL-fold metallo-hydrolase superfamily [uncultured Nocardioidaceae bacterium]